MKKAWQLNNTFNFQGRYVKWDSQGTGEPLVIVHGTPWSSYNLRHLIQGLSEHYQVFYFDLLGYGQSEQSSGDVSLAVQNQLLDALLTHWQLENPIAIGHDFGGTTVLRTFLLNQRRFQRLVVIDPVAISPWGSPFFQHVNQHEAVFTALPDYIHEAVVTAYIKTASYQALPTETLAQTVAYWTTEAGKAAFYRQIAQAHSGFTDEIQSLYPMIDVPTLILWGENDEWIPISKGKQLHQLVPSSTFVPIADSGHLVIEEAPQQLLDATIGFLGNDCQP